jgi:predicted HTH domain antitoxin
MNATLQLEVPEDLLNSASMTMDDVRLNLAIQFFQTGQISLGRAAAFANQPIGSFLTVLSRHQISPSVSPNEASEDAALLATLKSAQ